MIKRCMLLAASALLALLTQDLDAATGCDSIAGNLASVEGQVTVQSSGQTSWKTAVLNQPLCKGDTVRTAERSRASVVLTNQAVLRLDQSSAMRLDDINTAVEKKSFLSLVKGTLQSFSRKPRSFEISTPYLNGSIEGTEFVFRTGVDGSELTVIEGAVLAFNAQGSASVGGGEVAFAQRDQAPEMRTTVHPRDAARWSLYYPPVVAADSGEASPRLQQAASELSVGRVDEARSTVEQAIVAGGVDAGLAYALRAVINVVQNQTDSALADAKQALKISPDSAAAKIAYSYALQADFRLPEARDVLRQAVNQHPSDALALARLSELQLMLGETEQANETAEQAVRLDPLLGRAQMTLGFAALAGFRSEAAIAAFNSAISLNSADPIPHLGLGLALISSGDLKGGRGEIEVAVGLDSNDPLLRAYLGKAYFEEKRVPLATQQYAISKELDPFDPTPYLYHGILKQTENDPVGALREVEKSIELNGNRAVYRSRLLLDSDQAARSVSLARVHADLGFEQLALIEGYRAVNTDPTNYSAHRYLADSYSVLPRHEIARVSELLQSQLLNPLNHEPIQPRSAESNLFLISAGGPAVASYNEFNSLFKRNQSHAVVSGMVGEQQTGSGDAMVAGTYRNWSYSLGLSRFETDGFRNNNDQRDDIGNAFIQTALSPETSVQFEFRHRETRNGDLNLLIDETFSPALRGNRESDTYRGGLRHAFSPASTLLASVMYQTDDRSFYDEPIPGAGIWVAERSPDDKALGSELQYLYRSETINITAGVGYFDLDQSVYRESYSPPFCLPPDFFICFGGLNTETTDLSAKHTNAYVYSNYRITPGVTLNLGASWDSYDTKNASSESRDRFNPKLGVTWELGSGTTLRVAAFKALKRSMVSDQTLEPTQVAGFNQFYDDVPGTEAKRYGFALDRKFSRQFFGGIEVTKRDLSVPLMFTDLTAIPVPVTSVRYADWQEDSARGYVFLTPSDRLALSLEYQYQLLDRRFSPATGVEAIDEIKVHKVPLSLRFFLDSAWTFAVKGTYVKETYDSGFEGSVTEHDSDFWLADAIVSYRLPKRRGLAAIGATNLFDKQFAYQQVDSANTEFLPVRMLFGRVTLYFP